VEILTWNIRHGGGTRVNKIIDRIIEHEADIVIITEYRNNENGLIIRKALLENGYLAQVSAIVDGDKNTLLIAGKNNFSSKMLNKQLGEDFFRVINIEFCDLNIYGVYFPQKLEKKKIFEFMISEINNNSVKPIIFIGDFNTGKHYIDEQKNTFKCSEYISLIEQRNLTDAWRHINGEKIEYTWYSNAGNGFRIDHAFISNTIKEKIKDCYYSHKEREDKSSDHSALILEIDI
jgi:exodeoxyribonuclease III